MGAATGGGYELGNRKGKSNQKVGHPPVVGTNTGCIILQHGITVDYFFNRGAWRAQHTRSSCSRTGVDDRRPR